MKVKSALIGAVLVLVSVVFAACGKAEDGKVTTENAGTSAVSTTDRASTTGSGMIHEMSSAAGDVSEGLSEGASELRSDVTRMFE